MTEETIKTKRKAGRYILLGLGTVTVLAFLSLIGVFVAFKSGFVDSYVRSSLIERFAEFGIRAEIESVETFVSPTGAEIKNLQFFDEKTGEKLARIDRLKLDLTLTNILGLSSAREVSIDSTDVEGLEVWVRFDEKGNSNFSNLRFKADEDPNLKISLASINFSLKNATIHYGDQLRKISGDAKNITIGVEPAESVLGGDPRYKFDLTSEKSVFVYDETEISPINIYAKGIADKNGAEISSLKINSQIGESTLSGKVTNWQSPKYDLKVNSTIDLMQTGTLFPNGTALRGFGNFEGNVSGEGERYTVNGEISSESLAASNVRLKGLVVNGKVSGENAIYEGNGKAIAELLTFEDFRIDLPQLIGNVRGSGSDFKWFGELQAAAAKTPAGTLAGMFISDAVAEYKDKQLTASFGNVRANSFNSPDLIAENLRAQKISLANVDGSTKISAPGVQADKIKIEGAELNRVDAGGVTVITNGSNTKAEVDKLRAESLRTKDAAVRNLNADRVTLKDANGATDISAGSVRADGVDAGSTKIGELQTGTLDVKIRGRQTDVVTDRLKVAKVEADAAVLGSLNIAGVRLKIVAGRIEGTSGDIDAGNIDLRKNGSLENAKFLKPVFVLEPSGRYRASMDMSLGGGILGSVKLGAARASVVADSDKVVLSNLTAEVMDGNVKGNATIAMDRRNSSSLDAAFSNLDLAKLLALQGGKIVPLAGNASGKADLTFIGTDFKTAGGTVTAEFEASAGSEDRGLVPINGSLGIRGVKGLFDIDYAKFNTEKSTLNATGRFDLSGSNSNLALALNSTEASEIERLIKVLNISTDLETQLAENQINLAGNLKFNGILTGSLDDPDLDGKASLESISMRGTQLGALSSDIAITRTSIDFRNGVLQESGGGNVAFSLNIPKVGENNITVDAKFNKINTGKLFAAFPLAQYLPEKARDLSSEASGVLNLTGLPNKMSGTGNLTSAGGVIGGEKFDRFESNIDFRETVIDVKKIEIGFGASFLRLRGTYDTQAAAFDFIFDGSDIETERLSRVFVNNPSFPQIKGLIQLNGRAVGNANDFSTYDIRFTGAGSKLVVNETDAGGIAFNVTTENKILSAVLIVDLQTHKQTISAEVDLGKENLPLTARTNFQKTELAPFIAFLRSPGAVAITGNATGKVEAAGSLMLKDTQGKAYFTTDGIKGTAEFSEFALQFDDTPIVATQPILINFNVREVSVGNARFAGAGSNIVVSGTKALSDNGINNLTLDGKINLRLLNLASKNTFYSGLADVSVRLTGANFESRLSGSATVSKASISTFVGSERLNFERIDGRVIFTANQAQIERAVGYLGGGEVIGTGGALVQGLKLQQFRLALRGRNITAPLPKNFLTTGDAEVEITGKRTGETYSTLIAGTIFAKRSNYTKDIDLADFISSRREATISEGTTPPLLGIPRLDLRLQGRDALVVRNNLADLTASVDLRVTGDVDFPQLSGRITANSGTVFFRNDRYEVQRGTLEYPPQANSEPYINLQAETSIKGYQVLVNLVGELTNLDSLTATVRSNPSLPQPDVISLITTGSLSNTESGIPTYAQTGLNTAAEVITDSLINNPIRKATDKLFGLNKFEIDPILSGKRLNPTARLTVGRQVNKNLAVTYSTNLSEDQNQVLALEYRVSNRLSFVAQYEQRSLSNVTRNRDNFSFEIRLRKRF